MTLFKKNIVVSIKKRPVYFVICYSYNTMIQIVNVVTEDQIADQSRFIHELTVTIENVTVTRNYASVNRAFQSTIGYPEVLTSLHMKDGTYKNNEKW